MAISPLETARHHRAELIKIIAEAADAIAAIDRDLPILYSLALEADLLRAENNALAKT
jgi:hypothetical protein